MCDSSPIQPVVDVVDQALVGLDKTVNQTVGWPTVASTALAAATMGGSLALDAATVASADATAAGLGYTSAAEAIQAGSVTAEQLGLPAATTAADLGTVAGSASQGYMDMSLANAAAPYAGDAQYAAQDIMQQARDVTAAAGTPTAITTGSATSLPSIADIVKTASTGSQIIGGLGKLAGGISAVNQPRVNPTLADPFSAYRPQYASQLQNLMNNPNTVTSTPGYQFNLAQGLQGLQAQQAAQGRLVSGGALLQGQQFGQNLAQQTYTDQLKTLMALSGASQSPGTGATAMQSTALGNVGSTALGYNAIGSGLGQVLNPLATLYANFNSGSPNPNT